GSAIRRIAGHQVALRLPPGRHHVHRFNTNSILIDLRFPSTFQACPRLHDPAMFFSARDAPHFALACRDVASAVRDHPNADVAARTAQHDATRWRRGGKLG
ncbi:MAG TPA: hypothetical protein PLN33_02335, partial [Hyphomonadaceae bacterium]|nr:hypothetical protein [Hyphomonadaceae bacterium]